MSDFELFWKKFFNEFKDPRKHRAWTISLQTEGLGTILEHEMNTGLSRAKVENNLLRFLKENWPASAPRPDYIAVHHIGVCKYDPEKERFETITHSENKRGLPHRFNLILGGVPEEAIKSLQKRGKSVKSSVHLHY